MRGFNPVDNPISGARDTARKFDPVLQKWVKTGSGSSDSTKSSTTKATPDNIGSTKKSSGSKSGKSSSSKKKSQTSTKDKADKEYRDIEYNTLEGELSITLNDKTNKVRVGDTIQLKGLGTNLSGLYFITKINRSASGSSGYSVTLTVIKTGFGDGVKSNANDDSGSRPNPVEKKV